MGGYEDLNYFNDVIMDNCAISSHKINRDDVYEALRRLDKKLVEHVQDNAVDEKAILMQEQRSQLKILLAESIGSDYKQELDRLNYIAHIQIMFFEWEESSQH